MSKRKKLKIEVGQLDWGKPIPPRQNPWIPGPNDLRVLNLNSKKAKRQFLKALRKYGVPIV